MSQPGLPKMIMFYGPPGSGKGVQTDLLMEKFNLTPISWGESFRNFAAKYADDPSSPHYTRANRVRDLLLQGLPILTEDMMFILQDKIITTLEDPNTTVIMDKPGSLPPEAQWISDFLVQRQIPNCLIHLKIPFEVSVQRVTSRFYVPSDPREIPYNSYREAKSKCKEGEEPIRRQDDSNLEVIKHRYYDLYLANCEQVMAIYRQNGLTKILEIDAQQPIEDNFQQILTFLRENY